MGEAAEDLSMNYDQDYDYTHKEMCYCGRMVTEEERIFDGEKTVCIHCQYE